LSSCPQAHRQDAKKCSLSACAAILFVNKIVILYRRNEREMQWQTVITRFFRLSYLHAPCVLRRSHVVVHPRLRVLGAECIVGRIHVVVELWALRTGRRRAAEAVRTLQPRAVLPQGTACLPAHPQPPMLTSERKRSGPCSRAQCFRRAGMHTRTPTQPNAHQAQRSKRHEEHGFLALFVFPPTNHVWLLFKRDPKRPETNVSPGATNCGFSAMAPKRKAPESG